MNTKFTKGIFWGGIIASMILVINIFHYLFGGLNILAAGPHGHGPRDMGPHGGFEPHHAIGYHHSGVSLIWFLLFLILGITALVLVMKSLRKKSKASAMQQFIDTSLISSHKPLLNQNENVLDQWEKSLINKKENI
ncbi:hypothetical protein ABET41_14190 [Metabacillus fastidiosus]|uniref:Uncharacterized protein n=1 Tax=Metabacillus fastidiosus TaxID=1458 RepID=A0ABU6P1X2_9BACI|nr:hypothetical protein [Metabacillus fastidiosus]MED4403357.1 hypothetical protein [Metabacillus fastidiosus]MED4460711.1 hypothetical protein [Metabacillus fastidiosus]